MKIWVDADACPKIIKEILYRAIKRTRLNMILVANRMLVAPSSPFIQKVVVSGGFDVADAYIVEHVAAGDIVITADIPLADLVISKNAHALNPRGQLYTVENIKHCLAVRNLHDDLRGSGIMTKGAPKLNDKDKEIFANALDRLLTAYLGRPVL